MKVLITILAAVTLSVIATLPVCAGPLPPLINFQSVLLDEGGNLLPTGATLVHFQILDENREVIYAESQTVDVMKGAVSALIGNGSDAKGLTTGGIPADIFASGAPRYLQIQVDTQTPEEPMTIVPVPYAQWSQSCASVAKAAVGLDQLAPDVVAKLTTVTAQTLGSTGGATQIGVEAKFINSGSSSVQGVLQDLDLSVKKRQEETTFLTGKLNEEVTSRTNAVNGEIKNRTDAVASVQKNLDQELKDRTVADGGLQGQITKEIGDRGSVDTTLQNQINPIQTMLKDINSIPGTLSLGKVQTSTPPPSDLNMGGHKITSLADPISDQDAASKKYVDEYIKAKIAENAPLATNAFISSGSYQTCTTGINACNDIVISVGFKPKAIQIYSDTSTFYIEYFGQPVNTTTIRGWVKSTGNPGQGGLTNITAEQYTLTLNGSQITIPSSNGGKLNGGGGYTYYYTIWGTQ